MSKEENTLEQQVSFSPFYHKHKDSIYRLCNIMVHDKAQAEDLFQEVMLSIWKGLKNFRHDSKVETWVYRIVHNTSVNFNLKQKRDKERIDHFEGFDSKGDVDPEQKELLFDIISKLKSADRMIVGLYLEGYAYKEIAEILGMTSTNVGVKISRIKTELKKLSK